MFSQLSENIKKAITACGYTKATPIQEKAIPVVLTGVDLVASAQTGTGKTAAFVLPALHKLSLAPSTGKQARILILTPTRELAMQINKSVNTYGKFMRVKTANLIGGMPYHQQIRDLSQGADIIVATPGRLLDHINQRRVDLSKIEIFVLDEADRMLDMGFIDDIKEIAKLTPTDRQTLLFSATIDRQISDIIRQLLKNPVRIDLSSEKLTAPKIEQKFYHYKSRQEKNEGLIQLIGEENIFKAIIFSATKVNADRLADRLCDEGFSAAALHGDLSQNKRIRTVEQLRRGKIQFLVATDVAARGLDIQDISHVINYDLPRLCEDYVHRIGRTGRAEKEGIAISFVLPTEMRQLHQIEKYIGKKVTASGSDERENPSSDRGQRRRPKSGYRENRFDSNKSERTFKPRSKQSERPARTKSSGEDSWGSDREDSRGKSREDARRKPREASFGSAREGARRKPREGSWDKPREGAPRKPREDSWDKPREGARRKPREGSWDKTREGAPRKPREDSWDKPREGAPRKAREGSWDKPREGAPRKAREGSWDKPREGAPRKPREGSWDKPREGAPRKPRENSWGKSREDAPRKPREDSRGHAKVASRAKPKEDSWEKTNEDPRVSYRKPAKKFSGAKKRFATKKSGGFKKKFK